MRHIIKKLLVLMTLLMILSGCSKNAIQPKILSGSDITFFIASDTHYLAEDLTDNGEAFQKFVKSNNLMQLDYIDEILDAFISDIKESQPDVLIISGDLTTNGEKKSHLGLSEKLRQIEKLGTSVYVIPGNHDILNPYARGFKGDEQYVTEYVDDVAFSKIYGEFGYNEAISKDRNSLSYLVPVSADLWLMMLDTAQYKGNLHLGYPQGDGRINPKTFDWIKESSELAKKNNAQLITVMHHNLVDHSNSVNEGYTLNNNEEAAALFESLGMNLFFTGHIHLQDIKSLKNDHILMYDIASSALSVYPQKYGILKYSPGNGFDYSTSAIDVEGWAKKTGKTDKNLISFKDYSKDFFGSQMYNMVYYRLEQMAEYSDEELDLMAQTSVIIRQRYFEGYQKTLTDEIKNSQGFKLWEAMQKGGSYTNLMNMAYSDNWANNTLHISK